jgi:PAS domain S-box-containing protein
MMDTFIANWSTIIIPVVVFAGIMALWYVLWRIGWNTYSRWVRKTGWVQSNVISRVAKWPSFIWGVLLGVAVSLTISNLPVEWKSLASDILWSALVAYVTWIIIKIGNALLDFYLTRLKIETRIISGTKKAVTILACFIAALIILNFWGFTTTILLFVIAIFILLAMLPIRDMLPDVLAGFHLSTTWQIKKQDYIKLGTGEEGYVNEIGWMRTQLRAPDESIVLVANSKITGTTVTNLGPHSMKVEYDKLKIYTDKIEALMQEIASQRDEFQAILSSMAEGIVVLDPANRVISLNPAAEKLLGIDAHESVGGDVERYLPLDQGELTDVLVKQSSGESRLLRKRLGERVLSITVRAVESNENQTGKTVLAIRDITDLDRVDQMKSEFVSMVSHELRTPLTSIKGYVDMVLDGEAGNINEEQTSYLEVAKNNTDRLIDLVNELLDISRIEAGRIELKLRALPIQDIVRSVAVSLRTQMEESNIELKLDMPQKPVMVFADAGRLTEILTNLLINANHYSTGGASIAVSMHVIDGQARIDVTDTGIGIAPEDVDKIFNKFYRVDNSITRQVGGTGLGLAVTKSLVELHGGQIWVSSGLGEGSTFSFTIPLASGETAAD